MAIRGFKDHDLVACFTELSSVGNVFDINAFRNRPARDPADYLDLLTWHSRCFQYEVANGPIDVTITHTALGVRTRYWGVTVNTGAVLGSSSPSAGVFFQFSGDVRQTDILLLNHGQGVVPKFMVATDGHRVPDGWEIQTDSNGGARQVSVHANATGIYLRETAISGSATLAAMSKTYRVYVFGTRAPDPAKKLFGKSGSTMVLARGIVDSSRAYLRKANSGESPFALNAGPTLDCANGYLRCASGGVVVTEPGYTGSMPAPPFRTVGT